MLSSKYHNSGFTLLELIVVVAIIGILMAVITPSLKSSVAVSDILSSQQDIVQSIKKAKQYAKSLNTTVTFTITLNQRNNNISYTLPDGTNQLPDGTSLVGVTLPSNVTISATNSIHSFNPMGIIDSLDVITVTSPDDATITKSITILNLFGQLQVN